MQPVLIGLGIVGLVFVCVLVLWLARRAGVGLGVWGIFLVVLAGTAALIPVAHAIEAAADARTIAMGATLELGVIGLVAGVLFGLRQPDRMEGALTWIGVIIVSYLAVVLSFPRHRLPQNPHFSGFGAVLLSLGLYQSAFFLTHYLRHRRE